MIKTLQLWRRWLFRGKHWASLFYLRYADIWEFFSMEYSPSVNLFIVEKPWHGGPPQSISTSPVIANCKYKQSYKKRSKMRARTFFGNPGFSQVIGSLKSMSKYCVAVFQHDSTLLMVGLKKSNGKILQEKGLDSISMRWEYLEGIGGVLDIFDGPLGFGDSRLFKADWEAADPGKHIHHPQRPHIFVLWSKRVRGGLLLLGKQVTRLVDDVLLAVIVVTIKKPVWGVW